MLPVDHWTRVRLRDSRPPAANRSRPSSQAGSPALPAPGRSPRLSSNQSALPLPAPPPLAELSSCPCARRKAAEAPSRNAFARAGFLRSPALKPKRTPSSDRIEEGEVSDLQVWWHMSCWDGLKKSAATRGGGHADHHGDGEAEEGLHAPEPSGPPQGQQKDHVLAVDETRQEQGPQSLNPAPHLRFVASKTKAREKTRTKARARAPSGPHRPQGNSPPNQRPKFRASQRAG